MAPLHDESSVADTEPVIMHDSNALITPWEELTLANNYLFHKVMTANPDLCRRFIEHLLHISIERIEQPQGEFTLDAHTDSRGVRLDVYVKTADGLQVFDLEMQVVNKHNLPERARYYQGIIDETELKHNEDYKNLKTSYIMFLCLFDPFGRKLPVYTFQNRCNEDDSLFRNDRAYKVFYNVPDYAALEDDEEKAIFQLILDNKARSSFTDEICTKVNQARRNVQWRHGYMTLARLLREHHDEGFTQGVARGLEQGFTQGENKAHVESARRAFSMGLSCEQVAQITGLPLAELQKLQRSAAAADAALR